MKMIRKKAVIFDLDNTIYPVASIGDKLFNELFQTIERHGGYQGNIKDIKEAIQRKPFQTVAQDFQFDEELASVGLRLLSSLTYNERIEPFEDFRLVRKLAGLKFLVTTGFTKLQLSKIEQLGIKDNFDEFFIVDPETSTLSKKDIFKEIMERYKLNPKGVLIVGDDINSEIKAGKELGIDTVVYDYLNAFKPSASENIITNYAELEKFL